MARYDVYRNLGHHANTTPYVVDVQSDHLSGLITRVVIPLRLVSTFPTALLPEDLTPTMLIDGYECFLETPKLAAVPLKELKKPVCSAMQYQNAIRDALDRLYGRF